MADKNKCPSCGATLPDDLPAGLCAACLLAVGLPNEEPAQAAAPAQSDQIADAAKAQGATPAAPDAASPLANASVQSGQAPKPNRGLQDAQARNIQAVDAPKVNKPTGGPSAVLARRAI